MSCPSEESNRDWFRGDGLSAVREGRVILDPIEYEPGEDDIVDGVRTVDMRAGELRRCLDDCEKVGDDRDKFERVEDRGEDIIPDPLDTFEVDDRGESTIAGDESGIRSKSGKGPQKPRGTDGLI